mgnify:CR=1 FL=1
MPVLTNKQWPGDPLVKQQADVSPAPAAARAKFACVWGACEGRTLAHFHRYRSRITRHFHRVGHHILDTLATFGMAVEHHRCDGCPVPRRMTPRLLPQTPRHLPVCRLHADTHLPVTEIYLIDLHQWKHAVGTCLVINATGKPQSHPQDVTSRVGVADIGNDRPGGMIAAVAMEQRRRPITGPAEDGGPQAVSELCRASYADYTAGA